MDTQTANKALKYFGISTLSCSEKELKKIYFKKVRNLHPDLHTSKSIHLQNKYKNDFLEAHRQYQIAISVIREKKRNQQESKHNGYNSYQNKTFANSLNFNYFHKKKTHFSFSNSILFFFRFLFYNIPWRKFLFLNNKYFFLSFPALCYFLTTLHPKTIDTQKKKIQKKKEFLNTNKHKETYTKARTDITVDKARNDTSSEIKPLSKRRYIFNVVNTKSHKNHITAKNIQKDVDKKESMINSTYKKKYIKNILIYPINLKRKMNFYLIIASKEPYNINNQIKVIINKLSIFFSNISDPTTFMNNISSYSNREQINKNGFYQKKKKKHIIEKKYNRKNISSRHEKLPLCEDFVTDVNNRGEHNESRYINGVGGLCGGYILIQNNQLSNKTDDFFFQDILYMKKTQNKHLLNEAVHLQHTIIYEKMKHINFFTPLKKAQPYEKINQRLNKIMKYRNCTIPLKESTFENILKNLNKQKNNNAESI